MSKVNSLSLSLCFFLCFSVVCILAQATDLDQLSSNPRISSVEFQGKSSSSSSVRCLGNITDDFSDGILAPLWVDGSDCGSVYENGGKLVMDYPSSCPFYPSANSFY